jgi:hypothetical protein
MLSATRVFTGFTYFTYLSRGRLSATRVCLHTSHA